MPQGSGQGRRGIRALRGVAGAGKAARIAFLLPTVEYMAYANEHLAFDGPLGELLTGQLAHAQR